MAVPKDWRKSVKAETYEEVRGRLKSGDLVLFHSGRGFGRLIQMATFSSWSHVGMILRLEEVDRVCILESVPSGVRLVPFSQITVGNSRVRPYSGTLLIARHIDFQTAASPQALKAMSQFAIDRLGNPYASGEIVKIALRILLGVLPVPLPRMMGAKDEYICSEYVGHCFESLGLRFAWNRRGFLSPADIARDSCVTVEGLIASGRRGEKISADRARAAGQAQTAT